jgi:hypothetical protein
MALEGLRKLFPGIGVEGGEPDPVAPDPNAPDPTKPKPATEPDPGPKDPLDQFKAMFDNKPVGDPKPEDMPLSVANVLTPEAIGKLTENLDFNSFLSDATREALAKGEDPKAVFAAFNEIATGSYQTAITHSSTLSEKIVEDRIGRLEASLGEKINAHSLQSKLSANEIISKSPVLKAGISIFAERIQKSQPDADPAWVAEQATNYFLESAKLLSGDQGSNPGSGEPGGDSSRHVGSETDWLGFAMGDEVNNPSGVDPTGGEGDNQ